MTCSCHAVLQASVWAAETEALGLLMQCVHRVRLVVLRSNCLQQTFTCSRRACHAFLPHTAISSPDRQRLISRCTFSQSAFLPVIKPLATMRDFYGCYLLTSLDPKNKGRTYIGSVWFVALVHNATSVIHYRIKTLFDFELLPIARCCICLIVCLCLSQLVITGSLLTLNDDSGSTMGR